MSCAGLALLGSLSLQDTWHDCEHWKSCAHMLLVWGTIGTTLTCCLAVHTHLCTTSSFHGCRCCLQTMSQALLHSTRLLGALHLPVWRISGQTGVAVVLKTCLML